MYLPKSKSHKEFHFIGAKYKCWNTIPIKHRNIDDPKVFSNTYKQDLLYSLLNDSGYKLENAFDFFYKIKIYTT